MLDACSSGYPFCGAYLRLPTRASHEYSLWMVLERALRPAAALLMSEGCTASASAQYDYPEPILVASVASLLVFFADEGHTPIVGSGRRITHGIQNR